MINLKPIKVKIEIIDFETGELGIKLPDELVKALNWKCNDTVEWELFPGHAVLHKINK